MGYDKEYMLPTEHIQSLHFHRCIEIGICTDGSGTCIVDNRLYHYKKDDISIALPYQPHLANTTLAITSISESVGFDSLSCYTRAFKRFYGISPSEYRKHLKNFEQ